MSCTDEKVRKDEGAISAADSGRKEKQEVKQITRSIKEEDEGTA